MELTLTVITDLGRMPIPMTITAILDLRTQTVMVTTQVTTLPGLTPAVGTPLVIMTTIGHTKIHGQTTSDYNSGRSSYYSW